MKKFLDIKTVFIIILGSLLLIALLVNRKSNPKPYQDEINALHLENDKLSHNNDSLKLVNAKLDKTITQIEKKISANEVLLADTQLQLDYLNKRKNEIPNNINRLSANGVTIAFTNYLDKRTKGSSIR
jgi:cell division protein FtsB